MNSERDQMLRRVQVYGFALGDAALFLDTHPEDQEALAFYRKYLELLAEAEKAYVEKYGPLSHRDAASGDRWDWTDDPWPWQRAGEVR